MNDFIEGIVVGSIGGVILGIVIGFRFAMIGFQKMIRTGKIIWIKKP